MTTPDFDSVRTERGSARPQLSVRGACMIAYAALKLQR